MPVKLVFELSAIFEMLCHRNANISRDLMMEYEVSVSSHTKA